MSRAFTLGQSENASIISRDASLYSSSTRFDPPGFKRLTEAYRASLTSVTSYWLRTLAPVKTRDRIKKHQQVVVTTSMTSLKKKVLRVFLCSSCLWRSASKTNFTVERRQLKNANYLPHYSDKIPDLPDFSFCLGHAVFCLLSLSDSAWLLNPWFSRTSGLNLLHLKLNTTGLRERQGQTERGIFITGFCLKFVYLLNVDY